jgi:hypothetical protein
MPSPETVNTNKFTVEKVLFNYDDFSIASGIWNPNGAYALAMRWNDGEDGHGFPKVFGNPQWFIVSEDAAKSVLTGLLTNSTITTTQYQDILEVLKRY